MRIKFKQEGQYYVYTCILIVESKSKKDYVVQSFEEFGPLSSIPSRSPVAILNHL